MEIVSYESYFKNEMGVLNIFRSLHLYTPISLTHAHIVYVIQKYDYSSKFLGVVVRTNVH